MSAKLYGWGVGLINFFPYQHLIILLHLDWSTTGVYPPVPWPPLGRVPSVVGIAGDELLDLPEVPLLQRHGLLHGQLLVDVSQLHNNGNKGLPITIIVNF